MRIKIPFEMVALEDAKLFQNIKPSEIKSAIDCYYDLIYSCGWTIEEYEKELLSKIDRSWDINKCLN